jgi:hypothetical protein
MAELSGVVLGGVTLASMYKTCIEGFSRIQVTKDATSEFRTTSLCLTTLHLRFARWGEATQIDVSEPYRDVKLSDTEYPSIEPVRNTLAQLTQLFQEAEGEWKSFLDSPHAKGKDTSVYEPSQYLTGSDLQIWEWMNDRVDHRTKDMLPTFKRIRWAVYKKEQLTQILNYIEKLLNQLILAWPVGDLHERCNEDMASLKYNVEVLETLRSVIQQRNLDPELLHKIDDKLGVISYITNEGNIYGNAEAEGLGDVKSQIHYGNSYTGSLSARVREINRNNKYGDAKTSGGGRIQYGSCYRDT